MSSKTLEDQIAADTTAHGKGVRMRNIVGDLYQITEAHGRAGWIGAIVMATEIKSWGIQGFVHTIETHDKASRAYIRLKWDEIEHVGHAHLIPADEVES